MVASLTAFSWASAHVVDTPSVRVVTVKTFGFDVVVTSEAVEHAASKHAAAAMVNPRRDRKGTGMDMGGKRTSIRRH
ncbi:hypothetical protein BDI4_330009 [Burkholderia diffusa]|nr:hypothetical protein BDI4_330009 [Burkholderia diffusa]